LVVTLELMSGSDYSEATPGHPAAGPLPDRDAARDWLATMLLIRRFEERAGEAYTRAKIGGFVHLAIGEEAVIVGSVRAIRETDWLICTYRSHGHALARGSNPDAVMAELYGKASGTSGGRGGSMHVFDLERRFMGGWGIVGGNIPIGAGFAFQSAYRGNDEVTLCVLGDGATNQGTFAETLNMAALWDLPIVFLVANNRYGMGTSIERHSAMTDLVRKGKGLGVEGRRCDGMDVADTQAAVAEAVEICRAEQRPLLVEAMTYRFRGHSMSDPERYRSREQVSKWKEQDPIPAFTARLYTEGKVTEAEVEEMDANAIAVADAAAAAADEAPFPTPESLYDNVYSLGGQVRGWLSNRNPAD